MNKLQKFLIRIIYPNFDKDKYELICDKNYKIERLESLNRETNKNYLESLEQIKQKMNVINQQRRDIAHLYKEIENKDIEILNLQNKILTLKTELNDKR